jgi:S1-C subfamily serine protease
LYTYKNSDINNNASFTLAILKYKYKYKAHIISSYCDYCKPFDIGKIKAEIIEGAIDGIYDVTWKYKKKNVLTAGAKNFINFSEKQRNFLLSIDLNGGILKGNPISLIKLYPKIYSKAKSIKNGEWAGNGSGVIISKSGHIITNHHVIEDAEKIEVEFMLDDELQKFNAEVVQVDKTNDLAVLKIFDMNFDGVSEPPYNFKFRGSDVGTKVYAFGYPMALSIMGKEIKVTDGMISSKTGFDGNITTYQITAPIQGGNSGGPLFDEQANLIGINSSGIRKDIADNVAYSIKTSYVSNLLDVLPKSIELPSSTKLKSLPLTEQIKEISKYVVLVKVK